MKIGITGTRSGMTEQQFSDIAALLTEHFEGGAELHHGDCVGVDVEVAVLARSIGYRIVCHPPIKNELRAGHDSDEFRAPLSYFARNRNIVNETDLLLVVPYQSTPQTNGGTWYTHDYAVKQEKDVTIVYPGVEGR
jgi:hypothetical protein